MSTQTLLELLTKRKAATGGQKTIKPKAGRNRYRVLPGWRKNDDPTFYHDFGQHFVKDAAGAVKAVYICTDKTFGRPCDLCDGVAQAIQMSTDDLTKKRMEDMKSSGRVLLNVLELDGTSPTVPQILEVAPSVFNGKKGVGGIIAIFDEWPNMLDPVNGNDIIIEKSGAGLDTTYAVQVAGSSKPVPPEALTKLVDLDAYVQQESEQAAQRALASLRSVAGLPALAAPAHAGVPAGAQNAYTAQPAPEKPGWEIDETLDIGTLAMTHSAVTQPVVEVAATAVVQPVANAPVVATPATPAASVAPAVGTGDPELDQLLASIQ